MDWLGGWLKTVIMVILLATFIDLLLPSHTMQRYVKTVMSLIILLTLLSPVLELFQKNWNVNSMLDAAEQKQSSMDPLAVSGQNPAMKSLEAITQEADKLKAVGEQQSQELLEAQIANVMKEDLQKQTELQVDNVQVAAKIDNNGKPSITDVRVTLHAIEKPSEDSKTQTDRNIAVIAQIQPVKPIQIDIQSGTNGLTDQAKSNPSKLPPVLEQEKQKLILGISRDWQVQQAHIDVRIQSDGETRVR